MPAPVGRALFCVTCVLYSLVVPWQAIRIWRNARAGLAMGRDEGVGAQGEFLDLAHIVGGHVFKTVEFIGPAQSA